MANMEEDAPTTIECGFCLKQDMALRNPRQLTCSHVHCLECLAGFYEDNHMLVCPFETCRQVCEIPLGELPAFDASKHQRRSCDVCDRNGEENQHAFSYCIQCEETYCVKHNKLHQDYHKELKKPHKTVDIEEYELLQISQRVRVCAEHGNQLFSMGCKKCFKMICIGCVSSMAGCLEDDSHELMSLKELADILSEEINELKKSMIKREEALEEIFKFTSQTLAEYDEETSKLVQKIYDKRDEQIDSLMLQYKELEEELTKARQDTKILITDFLEDEVRFQWSQLRDLRRQMDFRDKHAHQCEVVSGHNKSKRRIEGLVEETLPSLTVPTEVKVHEKDGCCTTMLDVVSVDGFLIDYSLDLKSFSTPPSSLKFVCSISLTSYPHSVCTWNSKFFVGLEDNSVTIIDSDYKVTSSSLRFNNRPDAIQGYTNKLFILVNGDPMTIYEHDNQLKQVHLWTHNDCSVIFTGLAVTSDKIVAPDRENKLLIIYALNGNKIDEVRCSQISPDRVSLSACGPNQVVVSDCSSSQICMVDITQNRLLWVCNKISHPEGVVCYKNKYVLVGAKNSNIIRVLNVSTGELISELTDDNIDTEHVFDMCISEDKLIVASYGKKKIAVYQLQS